MDIRPKIRNAALVGALAAVAATAWAANETLSNSTYIPDYRVERPLPPAETVVVEPIAVEDSLSPNEALVASDAEVVVLNDDVAATPVIDRSVEQPAIVVEDRRLTEDQRIQAVVMERIAANPRISGLVGVESQDAVVRLSGYTSTVGQARHAERDARSVVGVRYVRNEIRPRVGGSV